MEIKALLAVLAKNKESTAFGGAECTEERNREAVLSAEDIFSTSGSPRFLERFLP